MRILLIHQYFLEDDDSGGSRFNEMTKIWTEKGHSVTVLAGTMHYNLNQKRNDYKGKLFVKRQQGPVNVYRCYVSESYNKNFLGRLWGYFSFVFSATLVGLTKVPGKHDVIIVTSPPLFLGITGYILSRIKRIPFLFEVRDLWPESAIDTGVVTNKWLIKLSYALERFIYRTSSRINVLTPAFRDTLITSKGIPMDKIELIPNAADFSLTDRILNNFDADNFRRSIGLEGKFVVTYVGAHGVANHLIQLLDVAETLITTNIVFQLIGEGMQKKYLKEEAKSRNLTNIIFVDAVPKEEVFKYILASDIGASVLKKVDTFKTVYSNKTFDYMACKKPILMVIDGVSRALVETAGCGLYAEPENTADIRDKIMYYFNNPEILRRHGENGYAYARNNFDRNVLAIKYIDVLEKMNGLS